MNEQSIIAKRIEEVRKESDVLRAKLADYDRELGELEAAAKVIARLTGAPGADNPQPVERVDERPVKAERRNGHPTMPELINMALRSAGGPLEPREITEVIRRNWWPGVEAKKIGSIVWRLNNRGDIEKIEGTSTYRLPQREEAHDANPGWDTSRASLFEPDPEAQGQKARPGGGT